MKSSDISATLDDAVAEIIGVLSKSQWKIVNTRYGLLAAAPGQAEGPDKTPHLTLKDVGNLVGTSRERVRQIQSRATMILKQSNTPSLSGLSGTIEVLLDECGGIANVRDLTERLTRRTCAIAVNPRAVCRLLLDISENAARVLRGSIYRLTSFPESHFLTAVPVAKQTIKSSTVRLSDLQLIKSVCDAMKAQGICVEPATIAACLRAQGISASEFNRHDLKFHLIQILRLIGSPVHYKVIAAKLREAKLRPGPVSDIWVGTKMSRERSVFVYIRSGTYGLVEWGAEDKRVYDRTRKTCIADIAEEFLESKGLPAHLKEIVSAVLYRKRCSKRSILPALKHDVRLMRWETGDTD